MKQRWAPIIFFAVLIGAFSSIHSIVLAFEKKIFHAEAKTSGGIIIIDDDPVVGPLRLQHTQLQRVSMVTKKLIVQGVVGAHPETYVTTPITALGVRAGRLQLAATPRVRISLRYRFVSPEGVEGPITQVPPIEGPNPTMFAFQMDPALIKNGTLQYKIIAEKITTTGIAISKTALYMPADSRTNVNSWISVPLGSKAQQEVTIIDAQGGAVVIRDGNPNDGESSLAISSGKLNAPTNVSMTEIPLDDPLIPDYAQLPLPVAIFRTSSSAPIKDPVRLKFLYQDYVFQLGQNGQDGMEDATNVPEQNLVVMAWDGYKWRKLATKADYQENTLKLQSPLYSYYALVAGASPLTVAERRPAEKIITPNGDGHNDYANMTFAIDENVEISFYDVTGKKVRTIISSNNTRWDGRDDSGSIVESGVYIYQYKMNGELVSGVVGVAK